MKRISKISYSAEEVTAVREYLLKSFPKSYAGCRRYSKSGNLRFLFELENTVKVVVFKPEFFGEHRPEAIPGCLDRLGLVEKIRTSRSLYLTVKRGEIEELV